jgi:hypothetical protein
MREPANLPDVNGVGVYSDADWFFGVHCKNTGIEVLVINWTEPICVKETLVRYTNGGE